MVFPQALGDLMSAGLDPSMIEMFFARFPSNITGNLTSALKDQATIDSLTSILKGMSSLVIAFPPCVRREYAECSYMPGFSSLVSCRILWKGQE